MPKADLSGEDGHPDAIPVEDIKCPACGEPAFLHDAFNERCRLDPDTVRRLVLGKGRATDAPCRHPDHNADIRSHGNCQECGGDEHIKKWERR
jgi:hypothetical protein